jgi:glycosyltransferase involved in cell wall biosynthesis
MMIAVVGTRGFPDVQGGVERHCEELYSRLAAQGFNILVFTRSPYVPNAPKRSLWRGIRFRKVWTPRSKSLEAIWHSVVCVILARAAGVRVVHIHAIGPGLAVPLARALGLRVVFTHHGRDYMRDKWGPMAKRMLRSGEFLAVRYAHHVLAVSREVEQWVAERFARTAVYAPNGIEVGPRASIDVEKTLASFGLQPREYVVTVARLVPEKGVHDLIDAVVAAEIPTLVVVGDADHRSRYANGLRAGAPHNVRFVGAQPHDVTLDLVRGARLFALPSYHEGLPIALLESLACGTPVVASNIDPNREVVGNHTNGWLVPPGNVTELTAALREAWHLDQRKCAALAQRGIRLVAERFSWEHTVNAVTGAYRDLTEVPLRTG